MPYLDVLVHTARVGRRIVGTEWVEGEYSEVEEFGPPFDCCLFLPQGTESPEGRGRRVREPTLLIGPDDQAGDPVAVEATDELLIVAPELNLAEGMAAETEVRWTVVGSGQPFGKPGNDVIGLQLTIRRVVD